MHLGLGRFFDFSIEDGKASSYFSTFDKSVSELEKLEKIFIYTYNLLYNYIFFVLIVFIK